MSAFPPVEEQLALITRGAVDLIDEKQVRGMLEKSAKDNKPLRVKLGIDPSSPDIHLGHTVVLRKLAQWQSLGHQAVLIIGNYTAMVGDPTGKSKTRPQLSEAEVEANAQTYLDQVGSILDLEKTEIRRNGEWFGEMGFLEILKLCAQTTVARMLERDDFTKRYKAGEAISLHEFLYPLMQGHDSVMIEADVELGGTDQLFNLLMGRKLQEDAGQRPQICLTTPLIEGLDGVQKMSKSLGNYIGVAESADEQFGKSMSIPDDKMRAWFTLLTDVAPDEIDALCDPDQTNPREAKDRMAREVVATFHGADAAAAASEEFVRRFKQKKLPDDLPQHQASAAKLNVLDLLVETKLAASKGEARRLVQQGGVRLIDPDGDEKGEVIQAIDAEVETTAGMVLKVGKRKFAQFA